MFTVNEIMELAEGLNDFLEKDSFIYLDHGDLDNTEKEREDIDAVWELAWDKIMNEGLNETDSEFITLEESSFDDVFGYTSFKEHDYVDEWQAEELIEYFEEQGYTSQSQVKAFFNQQIEIAGVLKETVKNVIKEVCDKYNEEHGTNVSSSKDN